MSDTVGAYFRGGGAGELGKKKEGALRSLQRPHRLKNKQTEEWQSIYFFFFLSAVTISGATADG